MYVFACLFTLHSNWHLVLVVFRYNIFELNNYCFLDQLCYYWFSIGINQPFYVMNEQNLFTSFLNYIRFPFWPNWIYRIWWICRFYIRILKILKNFQLIFAINDRDCCIVRCNNVWSYRYRSWIFETKYLGRFLFRHFVFRFIKTILITYPNYNTQFH